MLHGMSAAVSRRRTAMGDLAWVAAIVAFSVGAYLGAAVMAALTRSGKNKAYQQGIAECPRIHEWGENTG